MSAAEDMRISRSGRVNERARRFGQRGTPPERVLWSRLRPVRLGGFKFRRQHPRAGYIVDFYCPASRAVVELDGESHAEQGSYDSVRTAPLEALGNRVIPLTNHDIAPGLGGAQARIVATCRRVRL